MALHPINCPTIDHGVTDQEFYFDTSSTFLTALLLFVSAGTFAGQSVKEIGELDFLLVTFQGQRLLTLEELDLGDPGTEFTVTETFN
ncbi:MAG: hypothetical protein VXZ82_10850 [Planctomycetota bacterium]|nr:hypothetical protein [Planctomycetota bacterium]